MDARLPAAPAPPGHPALARWLPHDDRGRALALDLVEAVERLGLDPAAELLAQHRRFCPAQADAIPGGELASDAAVRIEPLADASGPCLWPHRPKRLAGELFSSWLWRAADAAGAPPRRFAAEALAGRGGPDPDRGTPPSVVRRLASVSGQRPASLLGGLLVARAGADDDPLAGAVDMALLHGDPLLLRRRPGGRSVDPVLQYCPACLATDRVPHFRRRWRLALDAACVEHGVRLRDGCWSCGAVVAPLAGTGTAAAPACHRCGAVLPEAPRQPVGALARTRQRVLWAMLRRVALHAGPAAQATHLRALSATGLGGGNAGAAERVRAIARLEPGSV